MKHEQYWKVKAAFLQRERDQRMIDERFLVVLREAQLDPAKSYDLSDADESITEKP